VEHRGLQYQIVQTANPTGFRWTVQLDASRTRTGTSPSKGNAIFKAVSVIDRALGAKINTAPSNNQVAHIAVESTVEESNGIRREK
jgi:hypothetical protein